MKKNVIAFVTMGAVGAAAVGIAVASQPSVFAMPENYLVNATEKRASEMTAQQMLDWLKKSGYKFVLETTEIPKDKTFIINLDGAKPEDAIPAIARALNLNWSKRGDVYVLSRSADIFNWSTNPEIAGKHHFKFGDDGSGFSLHLDGALAELHESLKNLKGLEFNGKKWDDLTDEEKAKFKADMEKMRDEIQKSFRDMKFDFDMDFPKIHLHGLSDKEKAEIEKEMKTLREELKRDFGKDGKVRIEIDEEIRKAMEDARSEIKDATAKIKIQTENVGKLIRSLTPAQKKLMQERGYLKPSDLTPEQKKMVDGLDYKGTYNISLKTDDGEIRIKSDGK
ncbi:hypothetical protein QM565_13875 [Geitlerinema splendidum]|nr:hypothetical protein [Geitlerinema splendidum]